MPVSLEPAVRLSASEASQKSFGLRTFSGLLALTTLAIAVHGYHLGAEDAAIYLPAIKQHLNPALYPFNSEFFRVQTDPMLFDELVAWSIKLTHLPLDWAIFLWHVLTIFGFLWAILRLAKLCFRDSVSHWSALVMVTALMTMPVAGTALYVFDQYLHPRSLSSVLTILAAADVLERRWWRAAMWILITLFVHPQMAVLGAVWLVLLAWKLPRRFTGAAMLALPFARFFEPSNPAWVEALDTGHQYYLLRNWAWYELLGAAAPLMILYGFGQLAKRDGNRALARLSFRTAIFGGLFIALGAVFSLPIFIRFAPTQPMRALYLVYLVMLLVAGGLVGRYVLRRHAWRWLALYLPMCIGLFVVQRALFPNESHIDWPGAQPRNRWVQSFLWVRNNTPVDAIFALAPDAMQQPGEDVYGFRAWGERSMLADYTKDAGVASFSPTLAKIWHDQVHSMDGWDKFTREDFHRLHERYRVTWVMVARNHPAVLDCPYQNEVVRVCRVD